MGKAFVLALMVVGLWIGVSIYTEGWDGAFGGALAELGLVAPAPPDAPPSRAVTERVRDRVGGHYREHEDRTRRALGED